MQRTPYFITIEGYEFYFKSAAKLNKFMEKRKGVKASYEKDFKSIFGVDFNMGLISDIILYNNLSKGDIFIVFRPVYYAKEIEITCLKQFLFVGETKIFRN